jgi:hypothetical protein
MLSAWSGGRGGGDSGGGAGDGGGDGDDDDDDDDDGRGMRLSTDSASRTDQHVYATAWPGRMDAAARIWAYVQHASTMRAGQSDGGAAAMACLIWVSWAVGSSSIWEGGEVSM